MTLLYYSIILAVTIGFSASTLFKNEDPKYDAILNKHTCPLNCHKLARDIEHSMNKSMDPCIDFYEYGCGNWEKNRPADQLRWNPIQYKTYRRVQELLVEENEYDKIPFIKKAKQFYHSCVNEDAIERDGLKTIKSLLRSTGGWPILMSNEEWYQRNYTWQNIDNFYLQSYGFSSFFNIKYEIKYYTGINVTHVTLKNRFLLHPYDNNLENDTYRNMYINYITKVVRAFSVNEKVQITEEKLSADVNAVLNLHINITNIIKHVTQFPTENRVMMLPELQKFYDNHSNTQDYFAKIKWLDTIKGIFNDLNVSFNPAVFEIPTPNLYFFVKLAPLLATTPPHVIVNYIQWNIVNRLMQYLNRQMRNLEFEYYPRSDVIKDEERWLTCVRNFPMNDIASYLFVKRYISADTINAVSEMTDNIKAALKEKISFVSWMNHDMKRRMKNKIDQISLQIGYPKWYDNRTDRFNFYEEFEVGKNYFVNSLELKAFERKKEMLRNNTRGRVKQDKNDWPIYPTHINAFYYKSRNMLVFPAALIQDPYFTHSIPPAVNYGVVGPMIAYHFVRSVLSNKIGIKFEDDQPDDEVKYAEDITEENFRERPICFFEQYKNYTFNMTNKHQDDRKIMRKIVIEYTAIQIAFAAFREMKKKEEPQYKHKLMAFTNLPDEQLFFLSLIHARCTSGRRLPVANSDHIFIYNPKKYQLSVILANMAYFSVAFKCPVNSPMNSASKCIFWY